MKISTLIIAFFSAFGFIQWPIFCGSLRIHPAITAAAVMFMSGIILVSIIPKSLFYLSYFSWKSIVAMVVCGILNGLAVYFYIVKVADKNINAAAFIATVSIFMILEAPMLTWIVKGESPSVNHIIGYVLAIVAIYFLQK